MGVFIHLRIIPERIDPQAWRDVYNESLTLVKAFPFMDKARGPGGVVCMVESRHRENLFDSGCGGWHACGDMLSGPTAENFVLYDDIAHYVENNAPVTGGEDILCHASEDLRELRSGEAAWIWCGKTQGSPCHIPLLSIACLICHRLPNAAVVDGDISAGQCRKAVDWANEYLENPIDVPVTADCEKLIERVKALPTPADKALPIFFGLNLSGKTSKVGAVIKEHISPELIESCYRKALKPYERKEGKPYIYTYVLKEYLELGLDFKKLCQIVMTDENGCRLSPKEFLKELLTMKLHISEKNTHSYGRPARERGEQSENEDVWMQLFHALMMMGGGTNRNVEVYIPLTEICAAFREVLGGGNYEELADEVLAELTEEYKPDSPQSILYDDPDSIFGRSLKEAEAEEYDIFDYDDLAYYEPGSTICPHIEAQLTKDIADIRKIADENMAQFEALSDEQKLSWFKRRQQQFIPLELMQEIAERLGDTEFIRKYVGLWSVDCKYESAARRIRPLLRSRALLDYFWNKN